MVGQLSASSNVSNSSYCSMAMRVATFADHWIIWVDQMRIKSSEHLIRMRCERCQREVEFQRSCAARARPGEFTRAFGPHALRHTCASVAVIARSALRAEAAHEPRSSRRRHHRGLCTGRLRRSTCGSAVRHGRAKAPWAATIERAQERESAPTRMRSLLTRENGPRGERRDIERMRPLRFLVPAICRRAAS